MNRKGITLIMLTIYIIVLIILASSILIAFFNDNQINSTEEKTFKSRINDYIKEYESNVNYNKINGVDITTLTIDELIPTITNNDKKILKLSSTGKLIFYNLTQDDEEYQYLVDLGLTNIE